MFWIALFVVLVSIAAWPKRRRLSRRCGCSTDRHCYAHRVISEVSK